MGKITFVLGGTRSGKSSYAVDAAKSSSEKVAYLATCVPYDDEMHERVKLHRKERPEYWTTFEEPVNLEPLLKDIDSKFEVIIIDCLTLFVSNLLQDDFDEDKIKTKLNQVMTALKDVSYNSFIVSNEVGLGIVPESELGRKFRDVAGRANQLVANYADEVFFVVSGLPVKIK